MRTTTSRSQEVRAERIDAHPRRSSMRARRACRAIRGAIDRRLHRRLDRGLDLAAKRSRVHAGARSSDRGESLVEIVLTVVIVGVTITALVSGLATVAAAGEAHRQGVRADTVMRSYAEAAKTAARQCTTGGTWSMAFSPPSGFTVSMSPATTACPPLSAPRRVTLTVDAPNGVRDEMTIVVRTP